jgi:hypothetical protein
MPMKNPPQPGDFIRTEIIDCGPVRDGGGGVTGLEARTF